MAGEHPKYSTSDIPSAKLKEDEGHFNKEDDEEEEDEDPLYPEDDITFKFQQPLYPDDDEDSSFNNTFEEHAGFDEALEFAGSWGKWQKWVFFLSYMSQVFCSIHAVCAAFLGATPEHWCQVPGLDPDPGLQPDIVRNLTIPWNSEDGYSRCEYYEMEDYNRTLFEYRNNSQHISTEQQDGGDSRSTIRCSSWVFDDSEFPTTLVTDFNLVCDRLWLKAVVQASYMSGLLVGSLVMGQLSDIYGRRKMTVFCIFGAVFIGVVASFVNSFALFLLLRFVLAFLNAGLMVICFVLVMEVVKPGARTFTGMMYAFFFGSGITILPGIAYFIRDWRYLQLAISLANGVLLIYYWFLPESPRWLASQGRTDEALDILKKIAKTNGRQLPSDHHMMKLISATYIKQKASEAKHERSSGGGIQSGLMTFLSGQLALVRTPIMRRRCLISFFVWFVSASAYYGLIFSGGNIKANIFLMIFVSGIVEIPSSLIAIVVMSRLGRRLTMCGLFLACGSCCLLILAVPKEMIYVNFFLVSLGKFFDTAVFQQTYLYTSELVPTSVRNIAVGTSSMFARIGCVITPFVIELLGELHYALPSTLFGILSIIAGLSALLLPETNNKKLPETIDDVEAMSK